jgi:hypothetical protein
MQPSGQAEADAAYKWVRESNPCQIKAGVRTKELAEFVLGGRKAGESISERERYTRFDTSR